MNDPRAEQKPTLDAPLRKRLALLADSLLPGDGTMPAASAVGVATDGVDLVLASRPDLREPLVTLLARDPFDADGTAVSVGPDGEVLTLVVAGAYYMNPQVRRLIGYPGQEGRVIDDNDYFRLLDSGLLEPVVERGPVFRPVPD